jgi:hypothetical protein
VDGQDDAQRLVQGGSPSALTKKQNSRATSVASHRFKVKPDSSGAI